jgi:type IV pilus assembly protein PilB
MSKIRLDATSEQNILNMLLDRSVINDNQLSKINSTSDEVGKTKLETAIELNLVNEEKIVSLLASTYSLEIVDLNEKKIDQKIKQVLDLRFIEKNFIVPFEILGKTLKIAIPDSSKLSLMKNLKTMTQMEPELYAATITNINNFINRFKKLNNKKISEHSV